MVVSEDLKQSLLDAAITVRLRAYAPYSKFLVGAALLCSDGSIHSGCNVENVAYPEGTCAEAGAIAAMCASGGNRTIAAVLVVADSAPPVTPCGGCRQKLAEFGSANVPIFLADLNGVQSQSTLEDMLPGAFAAYHIENSN